MQSEAYKITGFTAVMGAVGFLFRWLQELQIYDPLTGLPDRSAAVNYWLVVILVLTAAVLALWVLRLRRIGNPLMSPKAMDGRTLLHPLFGIAAGLGLAVAGFVMLVAAGSYLFPGLRRLLGLVTMVGGAAAIELTIHAGKAGKEQPRQIFSVLLTVMSCVWMVAVYKENAANPVVWKFAAEILALCAVALAFYFSAGYQFGQPQPFLSIYFCYLGMFLCIVCVIDEHSLADSVAYAAMAILLAVWGLVQTENIERPQKSLGIRQ